MFAGGGRLALTAFREKETAGSQYGLGLQLNLNRPHPRVGHGGAWTGFLTENRIFPKDRAAIAVFTNAGFSNAQGAIADASEAVIFETQDDTAQAHAHFILVAPDSWVVESKLGDPQKAAPCGVADGIKFTATDKVTQMQGGSKLHIKIQETIYHPGHYRVALSVKGRWELPADPEAVTRDTPRGIVAASARVDPAPKPPVLADGLFVHHAAQARESFRETDVQLPNISCETCTVQVIQFMEEHTLNNPRYFTYHHCADIKLTANPKLPLSKGWPKP